jgi:RHS repeat-associated protein
MAHSRGRRRPRGTRPTGVAGNLASMVSADGGVGVSYTWDSLNRLSTVVDNRLSGSNTTTYSYDAASNLATASYPNGLQTSFAYDSQNRVTGVGSQLGNYAYSLGATGNRTGATEPSGRQLSWNYDGLYRLTDETISSDPTNHDGSVAYGLDPVGNRLSANSTLSGVPSGTFSFNADDLMGGESYDGNGNTVATGGKTFTYDSDNRLKSMNGGAVTIVYDGDGNRVAKTVNGIATRYLVDDLNPTGYAQVIEESVNGSVQRSYSYGLQRIDEIQLVNSTSILSFYGYDGFGSVRQLTNAAGAVTDSYEYDAFGNLLSQTGSTPNSYLYRGEQYDSDLGLYYLRARYYNPLTGRFMSRDPEDGKPIYPKTLHKYLYAGGDPVNGFDPTGMATVTKPQGGLGGAAGEFLATVTDISLKLAFYTQYAIPAYLASPQGKLVIVKALGLLAVGAVITCEYEEFAHQLDPSKPEPTNCSYFDTPDIN